jgi:hypothetical protein
LFNTVPPSIGDLVVQSCGFIDDIHARGYGAVVYTIVAAAGKVGGAPNDRALERSDVQSGLKCIVIE